MPRGGRRSGKQYGQYANRADLRAPKTLPVQTAPNQAYGVAGQQQQAQRAVPMGAQPVPVGPPPSVPQPVGPTGMPTPLVPLDAPTMRPNEPLTTGVGERPTDDPLIDELRATYLAFPSEDLRELIEDYDDGRTF